MFVKVRAMAFAAILLFLLLTSCVTSTQAPAPAATPPVDPTIEASVDRYLQQAFHNRGGVQVALIRGGKTVFLKSYGNATFTKTPEPLNNAHFMHTASLTKQFTGWAVAQLVAQGKLKSEDPIENYLEVPAALRGLTLVQLLGHTHGLSSPDALLDVKGIYKKHYNNKDAIDLIFSQKKPKPQKKGSYGNAGYNLLAEVIAKVSGLAYRDYIQKNVLRPAGLSESEILSDCAALPAAIVPSVAVNEQFKESKQRYFTCFEGSIGLKSNAAELSHWIEFMLSEGQQNTDVFRVFSERVAVVSDGNKSRPYGMGVFIDPLSSFTAQGKAQTEIKSVSEFIYSHSGTLSGFNHHVAFSPSLNAGVVVLANASTTDSELIARNLFKFLAHNGQEGALYETQHVCDPKVSRHLSGLYPFEGYAQNLHFVTDGRCLWLSVPGRLTSVTESKETPMLYRAGEALWFSEKGDTGLRPHARRLRVVDKWNLLRASPINAEAFPAEPFLGVYKGDREKLEILVKDKHLYLKYGGNLIDLLWSGDQYLRTTDTVISSLRFVFSEDGEILGLKYSMNQVESGLFKKEKPAHAVNLLPTLKILAKKKSKSVQKSETQLEKLIEQLYDAIAAVENDPAAVAEVALSVVDKGKLISDRAVSLPFFYYVRAVVSALDDRILKPKQRLMLSVIDKVIADQMIEVNLPTAHNELSRVLFFLNIAPLSGETNVLKAAKAIEETWQNLETSTQVDLAQAMMLWSPQSANRILLNVLSLKKNKKAERLRRALTGN